MFVSGALVPEAFRNELAVGDAASDEIRRRAPRISRCFSFDEIQNTRICSDGLRAWYDVEIEFNIDPNGRVSGARAIHANSFTEPSATCVGRHLDGQIFSSLRPFPGRYFVQLRESKGFKSAVRDSNVCYHAPED